MRRSTISEIVAIDRCDHHMAKPQFGDRIGDLGRFVRIERLRQPSAHIAEGAGAGADLAHDHEGGVSLGPTLADIRTGSFLAHCDEPVRPDDFPRLPKAGRSRRSHSNPGRLSRD